MPFQPSTEQVVVAWIKSIAGVPANKVATTLPANTSAWEADGFVQVTTVGGTPASHTPVRNPVVQVDCWACNVNTQSPPWGKASSLANLILEATYTDGVPQHVELPEAFYSARLLSAYPMTEPRRITGDIAQFARVSFDLSVFWVVQS